jgi:predicted permease
VNERLRRIRAWVLRFGGLFRKQRADRDLADEIESNLQFHIDDNLRRGMSPQEARRQAHVRFGGVEAMKEDYRDRRGIPFLDHLLQDFRFGLRMMRKNPGFTAVAILTLALGIGANTAIFSVVNAVLLRSLPFHDAGGLVAISETYPSIPDIGASAADFSDWRTEARSLKELAAYNLTSYWNSTLIANGNAQEVHAAIVSYNLFPLLGITPAMGRNFLIQEDKLNNGPVAILSGEIWKTGFGSDPNILGRSVVLSQETFTVVGVLPLGIRFPQGVDVWVPLGNLDKDYFTNRFYHPLFAIGRLAPGASVSEARAEMDGITSRLASAYPQTNHNIGVKIESLLEKYVGGLRSALLVLWAAVGLVLLIACANVASLLLARTTSREGEMALRSALGANRARLVRQGLTESVVLAGFGALLGLLLAWASLQLLSKWLPQMLDAPIFQLHEISIDPRVLWMTFGVSIFSGVLFGIFPAVRVSRGDASSVLQSGQRNSPTARRRFVHRLAVAGEVALAVVVLISAGLLVRSLQQLIATSPGFRVDHLLTMRISLPDNRYNTPQTINAFYQRLLPKLLSLPGVEAVGTIDQTPLLPSARVTRFLVDGASPIKPGDFPVANARQVSPDYFQTMGIPLLKGRIFKENDLTYSDETAVLVINRTLAEQFFPGQNPIGRKLLLDVATDKPVAIPIVGVVSDVRDLSIDSAAPAEMYFVGCTRVSTLVVRSMADSMSMAATVRDTVLTIDSSQPVFEVQTATQLVDHSIVRQRFSATLLGLFSVLALVLSAGGIYGVTSYAVVERTREIGVRMALGAQPRDVLRLILRQEMLAAVLGIAVGIACAFFATKLLSNLLYGVTATDPLTYGGVCLALGGAAFFACYIPARRAAKVDPMVALRYE